jgi:hypothetical protein
MVSEVFGVAAAAKIHGVVPVFVLADSSSRLDCDKVTSTRVLDFCSDLQRGRKKHYVKVGCTTTKGATQGKSGGSLEISKDESHEAEEMSPFFRTA